MKILNKLLITICLLMVLAINYNNVVDASTSLKEVTKPVSVIAGYDYSDILVYDGYTGNYSEVDWKKEGIYHIKYQPTKGTTSFLKTVYVIKGAQNLQNIRTKKTEYRFTSNFVDVIGSYHVLRGTIYSEFVLYKVTDIEDDGLEFYLYRYEGDNTMDKLQIGAKNKFVIFDFLYDSEDELFYIIGTLNNNNNKELCYLVYDTNLNFIEENRFSINNGVVINEAVLYNHDIYLSGTTNSSNDFFYGCKDNDGFVLYINTDSKIIEKSYISKAVGYDSMSKVAVVTDNVYFIDSRVNVSGFSEFFINRLDDNFNIDLSKTFGSIVGFTVKDIEVENNLIYCLVDQFSYSVNKTISVIYIYDEELNLKEKINLNYNDYVSSGVDIEFSNTGILTVLARISSSVSSGYVYEQYYKNKLILSYKDPTGDSPLSIEGEDVSRINTLKDGKNSIIKISSISVEQKMIGRIDDYEEVKALYCFIDGDFYTPSMDISVIPNECKVFGDYFIVNGFEGKEFNFLKATSFYLNEQINVEESKVYNRGYQIQFNGVGYLNGSLIASGHYLNEEGEYVLEVLGLSNISRRINFEVRNNISTNVYQKELNKSKYNLVKNIVVEGNNDNYIETSIDIDGGTISTRDNLWIVLIPVVVALLTTVCVVRIKFSRN